MSDDKSIRERAYALWEEHGRPHGREHEHWEQARREIEEARAGAAPEGAAKPAKRRSTKAESDAATPAPAKRSARAKPAAEDAAAKPKRAGKKG